MNMSMNKKITSEDLQTVPARKPYSECLVDYLSKHIFRPLKSSCLPESLSENILKIIFCLKASSAATVSPCEL